jgi:hypothetical protein
VQSEGQGAVDWLKELAEREMPPDKNGRRRKITFIEIRQEFARRYIPEFAPKPKPKTPTMYERIGNL